VKNAITGMVGRAISPALGWTDVLSKDAMHRTEQSLHLDASYVRKA
jgi:hypothetical protein